MKSKRTPHPAAPSDLARHYQRSLTSGITPDFDERAYLEIAAHYRDRLMTDEALNVVDGAIEQFPYAVDLYLAKAAVLCDLHLFDYAEEVLQTAETYGPHSPGVTIQRAKVLAGKGLHEEAFAQLDLVDDLADPKLKSDRSVAEAVIFEHMHRYTDMFFFLAQALQENPTNDEALNLLWICTELTGRHAQTEEICLEIIEGHTYCSKAWYNLGHARYAQQHTEAALAAFEYAYIIDPRYGYAYREAGEICVETEQYARAVEIYEVMLEYVNGDNEILLRLGQCYYHVGAFTQARLCLNRVLTRTPEHDEALYYRGLCYAAEGRWRLAIKAYQRAVQINHRAERYAFSLAEALVETGDTDGAEAAFALSCEAAPEIAGYWLAHAAFLLDLGRGIEALQIIDEAEDHTYGSSLCYARVAAYLSLGREAEGLRYLAEVLPEEWDSHETLFEIAPALRNNDLVHQVIKCFA